MPIITLTLDALIGIHVDGRGTELGGSQAREGDVAESFDGIRLAKVLLVDLEKKRATMAVSDAGLLGATPTVCTFEIRWQGSRTNITAVIVRAKERREWTLMDRASHAKERDRLRLADGLKRSGLIR